MFCKSTKKFQWFFFLMRDKVDLLYNSSMNQGQNDTTIAKIVLSLQLKQTR